MKALIESDESKSATAEWETKVKELEGDHVDKMKVQFTEKLNTERANAKTEREEVLQPLPESALEFQHGVTPQLPRYLASRQDFHWSRSLHHSIR